MSLKTKSIKYITEINEVKSKMVDAGVAARLLKLTHIVEKSGRWQEESKSAIDEFDILSLDIVEELNKKFDALVLRSDNNNYNRESIKELSGLLTQYKVVLMRLENLAKKVDDLTKSYDEIRINASKIREYYGIIRNNISKDSNLISFCYEKLDLVQTKIENNFEIFEEKLDSGNYDEAVEVLTYVDSLVNRYELIMKKLPRLYIYATRQIPKMIDDLVKEYALMISDTHSLIDIKIDQTVEEFNNELDLVVERLMMLNLDGVEEVLNEMSMYLEGLFYRLEEEKAAKEKFNLYVKEVYEGVYNIERKVLVISRRLPQISSKYLLSTEILEKLKTLKKSVSTLANFRIDIDRYINSPVRLAYKTVLDKVISIGEYAQMVEKNYNKFILYIEDAEHLIRHCKEFYNVATTELISVIGDLRKNLLYNIVDKYNEEIVYIYTKLESMRELSANNGPFDVEMANKISNEVQNLFSTLVRSLSVEHSQAILAENVIIFANRYRTSFNEVDSYLIAAENDYQAGRYNLVLDAILKVIEKVDPVAYSNMVGEK